MKGGTLHRALEERGTYTEEDARAVMRQLLHALVYLHDAGVTHRDIKLENILLTSALDPSRIKLSDFGLSATGTSELPTMTERCGTPLYAAPEVIERDALYGNKADLWSTGVVLFQLLSGYPPFSGKNITELLTEIGDKRARIRFDDPVWDIISGEARNLVESLLAKDPLQRLSAREALMHPWMMMNG